LSSGFSDRYTVHYATSGSEALNTLVETPINVIISAQDLPGMSGLEALREAKKRSPEIIGILLAGSADRSLEALVGEKEVFQIVRGNVTAESVRKIVDSATQQVRLMALAESANDMAANVDEPAEHIVMETSENGSTIISDGTGRMPALDPEKVTVHYANTVSQADEIIRKHKVGVAVVDAGMIGKKIERLTQHLRKGSARLVSIVAGRRDDGEMLMDLINRGKVYRFLLKPVSPGRARLAVEASVKHHLEAPDAAFKLKGTPAAPKAAPKPAAATQAKPPTQAKPQPKPVARPAPAAKAQPAPKPVAAKPNVSPASAPADPPLGEPKNKSPIDHGLSSAFEDNGSNFTATLTGLISSFKENRKEAAPVAPAAPAKTATAQGAASPTGGMGAYCSGL
jgi:DNA-binding response OmpR family regulator